MLVLGIAVPPNYITRAVRSVSIASSAFRGSEGTFLRLKLTRAATSACHIPDL